MKAMIQADIRILYKNENTNSRVASKQQFLFTKQRFTSLMHITFK